MIKKILITLLAIHRIAAAQILPADRITDWSLAGYQDSIPAYSNTVNITAYGAVGDGIAVNDSCIQNAIAALNGLSGVVYFPAGNYYFTQSINLPDSVVLRSAGADSTTLSFNLNGNNNLINIRGSIGTTVARFNGDATQGDTYIILDDASMISAGDYLRISFNDVPLLYSSWAYGSVGQVVRVESVLNNRVNIHSPLRRSYSTSDSAKVGIVTPRKGCGIECLKIDRLDASAGQTTNIDLTYAAYCWLRGVESNNCNFTHVGLSASTNIEITGCYFHHAHAYGGGGQGYGVTIQSTSGECLIENNIFNHLRHSILLQSGANGNVCAYNYSMDPFWENLPFVPANSSGDLVLHGNYPYMNLFEGNIVQNMMIDNSHGLNGPYNTLFRNRAELYGFIMSNATVGDNQNIIGNEIPNTGNLMGQYSVAGSGHFTHGNNVKGAVRPAGTATLNDTSYYKSGRPAFLSATVSYPPIGYPNTLNSNSINAKDKQTQNELTDCNSYGVVYDTVTTSISTIDGEEFSVYPNPGIDLIYVSYKNTAQAIVSITELSGKLLMKQTINQNQSIDVSSLSAGMYILNLQLGEYNRSKKLIVK